MRKLAFFNNASLKLAATLTGDLESFSQATVEGSINDGGVNLPSNDSGYYTVATITNASMPGEVEIVYILGSIPTGGDTTVFIERAREGTSTQEWPVGSTMECRLTMGILDALNADSLYSAADKSLSLNGGDVVRDRYGDSGDFIPVPGIWSIGGMPCAPAVGIGDDNASSMSASVEAVGYSAVVELAIAPDYNPATTYYPGQLVKDTDSPFATYSLGKGTLLNPGPPAPGLGDWPWTQFDPASDSDILAFPRISDPDIWFYPTEIGFICDRYTATTAPSITVKEVDRFGDVVGADLVTSQTLTGIGARTRIKITDAVTKGLKGFNFVLASAGSGGSCQGRFYWKGVFITDNSSAGAPSGTPSTDGRPEI